MVKKIFVIIINIFYCPWKLTNEIKKWVSYPFSRFIFAFYHVHWKKGWKLYGTPILQKHYLSHIIIDDFLQLRSFKTSNPLSPNHAVTLCTWKKNSQIIIGHHFSMTGGTICAAEKIQIGNNVTVGANSIITDTDFHPSGFSNRIKNPQNGKTSPVFIEDGVFIGTNCLILKGVRLGNGCVIGAGSVVSRNMPKRVIAVGNPAQILKKIDEE